MKEVTEEKVKRYFNITKEAISVAKASNNRLDMKEQREDFLDMIERYYSDAEHFYSEGNYVLAFAALNYAHGWLDAGARLGLFDVHDNILFTVD